MFHPVIGPCWFMPGGLLFLGLLALLVEVERVEEARMDSLRTRRVVRVWTPGVCLRSVRLVLLLPLLVRRERRSEIGFREG